MVHLSGLGVDTNLSVLYCHQDKSWKLVDFGLTSIATSRQERPTLYRRGTPGYRAPELIHNSTFTNANDIWALGCIMHELATSVKAFLSDISILDYKITDRVLLIPTPSTPKFLQHHVTENIQGLLHRDPKQRPSASTLARMFTYYSQFLDCVVAQDIVEIPSYPSYLEWVELSAKPLSEFGLLYRLTMMYMKRDEEDMAIFLLKDITRRIESEAGFAKQNFANADVDILWDFGDALRKKQEHHQADAVYKATIKSCPDNISLVERLAAVHLETDHYSHTLIQAYENAIRIDCTSLWSWHSLCRLHLARGNIDRAITICRREMTATPTNPVPLMVLSNLYSIDGNYQKAIRCHAKVCGGDVPYNPISLRTALDTFTEHLTPSSARIRLMHSLKRYRQLQGPF